MAKKVSKQSMDITKEKIAQLKKLFPEVISEGKIDVEKFRRTLGEDVDGHDEKYGFNWAGRKDTFKNIQTTAKGTLIPADKESINWDKTENIFIEGDNLEVLKQLQKGYFGKIKMAYIDPPYNRGKGYDLIYNDEFGDTIKAYLVQTGQISKDGFKITTDLEIGGRYHSNWISMMYPRLFMARNLLKEDGVILVSINDREFFNLRNIMNEVFGEENFVGAFIWKNKAGGGGKQSGNKPGSNIKKKEAFVSDHEYIVVYAKDIDEILRFNEKLSDADLKGYSNPDKDSRGPYKLGNLEMMMPAPISTMYYEMTDPDGIIIKPRGGRHQWRFCEDRTKKGLKDGSVIWAKVKCKPDADKRGYRYVLKSKQYLYNGDEERTKIARSILYNIALNADGTREIMELFDQDKTEVPIFSNPKPTKLLKYLLEVVGTENEIILDFFAGSGSTAHAILNLNKEDNGNRKFICVQLPEKTKEKSEAYKAGYKTIAEISKERIRRSIKKLGIKELGFKVFKLQKSNYKIWENYEGQDKKELAKQMQLFKTPLVSGYKDNEVIYECIIKEGYSLNSKIENLSIKTNKVYKVVDGKMFFYICLDQNIKDKTVDELKLKKDIMLICLDESLTDSKKTNLAVQCNLKTI
jgi:adenine-specific DNA-methyltransferase